MNQLIPLKGAISLFFIALALLYFAILPKAQAVVPPPDGGYPGFTTAEGTNALKNLTTGAANTAVGWFSLFSDAEGSFNTATGAGALLFNTADNNTAIGAAALLNNTTGGANTAIGTAALLNNTTAVANTAIGDHALFSNIDGINNTATGYAALSQNTTGYGNTASGGSALSNNAEGFYNTANGALALYGNRGGNYNTAIGYQALYVNASGVGNTAIGTQALLINTGSYNVVLAGGQNLTTGDFNIDIGNDGVAGESNTIRIGNPLHNRAFIAGINGVIVSGGTTVYINSDGQLGTNTSSARFKQDIQSMDKSSELLLALRPVTFRYKPELDPKGIPQFGLVAEDVEKVNPDLIVRDKEGKPYTVRYDAVNAMLLNEFLKEHQTVQELKTTVAQQKQQIDALAAGLQKMSAQIEMSKLAANVARNTQ